MNVPFSNPDRNFRVPQGQVKTKFLYRTRMLEEIADLAPGICGPILQQDRIFFLLRIADRIVCTESHHLPV